MLREVIRLSNGTTIRNSLIPLFQDRDVLSRAMDYYQPHYVHFCEDLSNSFTSNSRLEFFVQLQSEFKEKYPEIGIIRSIPIPEQGTLKDFAIFEITSALEPVSDILLIDTWSPTQPVKGFIGITGRTADWERAR